MVWQSSGQSGGASKKKRKSKRTFHLKRMDALCELVEIAPEQNSPDGKVQNETSSGTTASTTTVRLILNDFSVKGVGFFSAESYLPGQEIRITLTEPKKLVIHAKIAWCQEHNLNSHVISKVPFAYRAGAEFVLKTPEETSELEGIIEQIQENHLLQK